MPKTPLFNCQCIYHGVVIHLLERCFFYPLWDGATLSTWSLDPLRNLKFPKTNKTKWFFNYRELIPQDEKNNYLPVPSNNIRNPTIRCLAAKWKRDSLKYCIFCVLKGKDWKSLFFQDKTASKLLFLIEVCVQRYQEGGKAVRHEK